MNFEDHGFTIHPGVLSPSTVERFRALTDVARQQPGIQSVSSRGGTYGLRNLTDVIPEARELVTDPAVASLVTAVLGPQAFMVRATLFDKLPDANWGVFWHQDLSIAIEERHDVPGYHAFTRKAGVVCVQPPVSVMEQILTVRLHLDDCTAENGALRVLPGTHRLSRLSQSGVEEQSQRTQEVVCEVPAGGALLMRPLLLHASSPMTRPTSRRVIHFEFSVAELPPPLQWKYRIPCLQ